jgi:cysteinyl-tRNA synthetase
VIQIYNTLTRQKELLETLEPGRVRMYVCGPTVYDKAHIGHAMSSIVFDVIRRYLEYRDYEVLHVMNYTDVDDKVIDRAHILGADPLELAESYAAEYDRHIDELNILHPHVRPRASDEIEQIVAMVEGLVERGYAYALDGDVYFQVSQDQDYGKLSRRKPEEMRAGARLEVDERKQDPADFALWKAAKPGEPSWESPWGAGRPGWHIECSAMNLHHLGEQIDIHGGGNDLIFPHHENEIAQSESLTDKQFSFFWVHNGMMQLGGEAMSKSTGNVLTIDEFLAEFRAEVLRLIVLNSHYRSPLGFSQEIAEAEGRRLERLQAALKPADGGESTGSQEGLAEAASLAQEDFAAAMNDDFNTPQALAVLADLVRSINQARDAGADDEALDVGQGTLLELAGVLGLRLESAKPVSIDPAALTAMLQDTHDDLQEAGAGDLVEAMLRALGGHGEDQDADVAELAMRLISLTSGRSAETDSTETLFSRLFDQLVEIRSQLRESGQWELADRIRSRLTVLGIELEDGKRGTTWRVS